MQARFNFELDGEQLGMLFMPRAGTFEILQASVVQEQFIVDQVQVDSPRGSCRLVYSEWEEGEGETKRWISEYAIELVVDAQIAYGTYGLSLAQNDRHGGMLLDRLKRDAEHDFMLCAKLLGRLVRRDLVIDEDSSSGSKSRLH